MDFNLRKFFQTLFYNPQKYRYILNYDEENINEHMLNNIIINGIYSILDDTNIVNSIKAKLNNHKLDNLFNTNITEFIKKILEDKYLLQSIINDNFKILKTTNDVIQYFKSNPKILKSIIRLPTYDDIAFIIQKIIQTNNFTTFEEFKTYLIKDIIVKYILKEYYSSEYYFNGFNLNNESYLSNPKTDKVIILSNDDLLVDIINWLISQTNLQETKEIIIKYIDDNKDELNRKINTINFINSDKINNKKIPIDLDILISAEHSNIFVPIIYINGNVIEAKINNAIKSSIDLMRINHEDVLKKYFKDSSLHKNDIEKYDFNAYWSQIEINSQDYLYWTNLMVRAILNHKQNTILILTPSNHNIYNQGLAAFINEYPTAKIFTITDDALYLEQIANKKNRLFIRYV